MYCKHDAEHRLVRTTIANGSVQVRKQCAACRELFGSAVGQRGVDMAALAEFETGYNNPPCVVCGSRYTELNHFFPVSIARKAGENPEVWPMEYLCRRHHHIWHSWVTPGLVPEADKEFVRG